MNNSLLLKPKQALNKAFRKVKPTRDEIETFKKAAIALLDGINPAESEEHHKNLLIAFLNQTGYQGSHAINTKDRTDLAIHHGPKSSSEAGVLIEAKRPPQKPGQPQAEMLRPDRLNATALQELLAFLDAYDVSSDNAGEEIQEQNKPLINASVLGLIFEKINGYKEGSFFTPGFMTMYMCRETLRRAVCQRFSQHLGKPVENIQKLYDLIDDKQEANALIDSMWICDPAVGLWGFDMVA